MSLSCEYCVFSCKGLGKGRSLVQRSPTVCVCDQVQQ
jgi:hypothetical protein